VAQGEAEVGGAERNRTGRRHIAVVGSGIAGLTAAYVLQRSADVTLYEADARLGGHSHTHDVIDGGPEAPIGPELTSRGETGPTLAVDSGFIVHNSATYPTLLRLFAELGVQTQEAEMSMSVSCAGCGLEYAGARGARGLFAQPRSLARGRYLHMLTEVPRFHRAAKRVLAASEHDEAEQTLAEFLAAGRYSSYFVRHFITPMVAAVWSCAPADAGRYPARYLFTFLENHGALSVSGSPTWRTVVGGSRTYVDKLAKELSAVFTATPVRSVRRLADGGAQLVDDSDTALRYDGVVVAAHPDQALAMLADATPAEREILGTFRYSANHTLLHTDASILPAAKGAMASWNYRMASCHDQAESVMVSYDMTRLQRLPSETRYIVSLGAGDRVDPRTVIDEMVYEHPTYNPESLAAQRRLPELTTPSFALAGAWHGWGFHEDGARSGLAAAQALGGSW
jgi:predicted NAD/FAD-binding protein